MIAARSDTPFSRDTDLSLSLSLSRTLALSRCFSALSIYRSLVSRAVHSELRGGRYTRVVYLDIPNVVCIFQLVILYTKQIHNGHHHGYNVTQIASDRTPQNLICFFFSEEKKIDTKHRQANNHRK